MLYAFAIVIAVVAFATGVGWVVGGQHLVVLAALCVGVQWVAFVPAWLARTERFYDLAGSFTYIGAIALALALAPTRSAVSWLVSAAVVLWAVRLGSFLVLRIHRAGKDGRFDEIKLSFPRFLVAWTLQGLWVFMTALSAVTLIGIAPALSPWMAIGGVLWGLGFAIEVVADRQKREFKADPANAGKWIHSGLWAWSRHPNYAGEIMLWTGIFIVGLTIWTGAQWLTVLSPLFVAFLLTRISGIPLLERRADERWSNEQAYQAYKERTPVLWPGL